MRIVLSVENLNVFGGTESYMLTVAQQLERMGHQAALYSPNPGPAAEFAREQGVAVVGRSGLAEETDLVLAQDAATAYELAARYPDAVRVFVAHSGDYAITDVPQLEGVCHAAVAMSDRVARWLEAHAAHPRIVRLRQPIDPRRFRFVAPPHGVARSVLVSSNQLRDERAALIEAACARCALEVHWIGATSAPTSRPEHEIERCDVVIGVGRTVLEAMACGRAALVYGVAGGDGWVTPDSYPRLEADGFAGRGTGAVMTADALAGTLSGWERGMGVAARDLVLAHHSARWHAVSLVELARELALDRRPQPPTLADELARLVRLEWQTFGRAAEAINAAAALRQENERLAALAADTEERLRAVRSTRCFRVAGALAAPLDRLRAVRSRLRPPGG